MMTTVCALIVALPLAVETGAGAELRKPMGIAIVGGLDCLSAWLRRPRLRFWPRTRRPA